MARLAPTAFLAAALWAASALPLAHTAQAEPALHLHRGVPTDIWLTWPEDDRLGDPAFLSVFPEWRRSFGAAQFQAAKAAGFDFVRMTIDPAAFLLAPSDQKTESLIAGTLALMREARGAGLNVLIDLHAIPKGGRSLGSETYVATEANFASYLALVRRSALALAGEDAAHVGFEPFNEPTLDCDMGDGSLPRWPALALQLHDAFRAHNRTMTLVMSGACWGSAQGLAALDPAQFHDNNILWSFHSYEPFLASHQGASWSDGPTQYIDGVRFPPDAAAQEGVLKRALKRIASVKMKRGAKAELAAQTRRDVADYFAPGRADAMLTEPFTTALAWAKAHDIPAQLLFLGEFGAIKQDSFGETPLATRATLMARIRTLAEVHGMAWSTWSWGGSFSLTDDTAQTHFSPELLKALGLAP
jgi:aryl-phospho-beta-D-glucosidase BglC (GH1 family)